MFNNRKRHLLGSLLVGLLCSLGFGASAQTQDKDVSAVVSARAPVWTPELGEVPLDKYTREELSEIVRSYWTPERMRDAIPVSISLPESVLKEHAKKLNHVREEVPEIILSEPALPRLPSKKDNAQTKLISNHGRANGKVFFYDPVREKHFVCSGSAINSSSKRVVATAAHCVHKGGPSGYWYQNWFFIPNYSYESMPDGYFSGLIYWALPGWINYGESAQGFNSDVAFVTTGTNYSGTRVVDAVGGHGITYGGGYEFDAVLFGYPTNITEGQEMQACSGATEARTLGGYEFVSISGCGFGKGASGGPWLKSYNSDTGIGTLRGVSSWILNPEIAPDYPHINSPYFTSHMMNLFINANSASW